MATIRVFYTKTMRAKYNSHLDTMRTVTRALRRSRLPLWYTEGFNPHMYITFALPLSLGYEGLRESFDVRLTREMDLALAAKRMRAVMPTGFEIVSAAPPVMEPREIAWADYEVRFLFNKDDGVRAKAAFESFDGQPSIDVVKRTKKGDKQIDIRPFTQVLSSSWGQEGAALTLRMAAGISLNINPTLYLKAFYSWAKLEPEGVRVVRTAILNAGLESFR